MNGIHSPGQCPGVIVDAINLGIDVGMYMNMYFHGQWTSLLFQSYQSGNFHHKTIVITHEIKDSMYTS